MKILLKSLLIVGAVAVIPASLCDACSSSGKKAGAVQDSKAAEHFFAHELAFTVSPIGLKHMMEENKDKITIVDVRAKEDYEAGHVQGAVNVPYPAYKGFKDRLEIKEIPGLRKDGFNLVYCYDAYCNLGTMAAEKMAQLGYPVKEVIGGFEILKEKGLPIEKGPMGTKK